MKMNCKSITGVAVMMLAAVVMVGGQTPPPAPAATAATAAPAAAGPVEPAAPAAPAIAPDETIMSIAGQELKKWQIDVMLENRAGQDLSSAADFWLDIQLKAQEARRRGLDKTRQGQFILELYRDYFLSNLLTTELAKEAPAATEEQAKADYDANNDRYKIPFTASVEHIILTERDKAAKALAELKAPQADFNAVYTKYNSVPNDRTQGRLYNTPWPRLEMSVGKEAAAAIKAAKEGDILGPLVGLKGFEIIKVVSVQQERMPAFEEIKTRIMEQMNRQTQTDYPRKVLEELKAKTEVKKSDALLKAEAELKKQQEEALKQQQEMQKQPSGPAGAPAAAPAPAPTAKPAATVPENPNK